MNYPVTFVSGSAAAARCCACLFFFLSSSLSVYMSLYLLVGTSTCLFAYLHALYTLRSTVCLPARPCLVYLNIPVSLSPTCFFYILALHSSTSVEAAEISPRKKFLLWEKFNAPHWGPEALPRKGK